MDGTSSPFPGMLECCRLSVTLHVMVLFLANKYQQTLDISLGTCPTVFPSTTPAAGSGVAMVCLCSRLLHMVTCTLVHWFVISVRCRWTWTTHRHRESRTSRLPAILGRCVGVRYPVVGCDNVLFRCKMQRCYKYPPTPLSKHKVMCTAHGSLFARLRYIYIYYLTYVVLHIFDAVI